MSKYSPDYMTQINSYSFNVIGTVHSCYKEKFGIPRQPGLVAAPASIEMEALYSEDEAFRQLEHFSHIWVIFIFHDVLTKTAQNNAEENKKWQAMVRPPRLGGNQRVGVFASRSMFRPNPLGLSVVELQGIKRIDNKIILNIIGGDFLDGTPVVDIKPYIPYADSVDAAKPGYAAARPAASLDVSFSDDAKNQIEKQLHKYPLLEKLITDILQLDPRPAYQQGKKSHNEYAMRLYEFDLKWQVKDELLVVNSLTLL